MRKPTLCFLAIILLLAGCQPVSPTRVIADTAAAPAVRSTSLPPTASLPSLPAASSLPTPTPFTAPTPGPLTHPTVLNRYPLPPGMMGESLAASPGRMWAGTSFGTLEEFDATTGAHLKTHSLVSTSTDGLAAVNDIAFDGQNLWAVVAWEDGDLNPVIELFAIQPTSGEILRRITVTDNEPGSLGAAPGQMWTQNLIYSTETHLETPAPMETDSTVFAYDQRGWMWVGGLNACDSCETALYRYRVDNPAQIEPGPAASYWPRRMILAGSRLWVLNENNRLDAYDPAAPDLTPAAQPAASLDLSAQMQFSPAALVYDGQSLWLLSSAGSGGGTLYQHDPLTGQRLAALSVGDSETESSAARIPVDAAFDGSHLWVLTAFDLVRIGLPAARGS